MICQTQEREGTLFKINSCLALVYIKFKFEFIISLRIIKFKWNIIRYNRIGYIVFKLICIIHVIQYFQKLRFHWKHFFCPIVKTVKLNVNFTHLNYVTTPVKEQRSIWKCNVESCVKKKTLRKVTYCLRCFLSKK